MAAARRTVTLPSFLLGFGLGGFVDGILLHQVLQWHHLVSDTRANPMTTLEGLEANTLADGFFHVATWLVVAVASTLAVRAWRRGEVAPPWRAHVGLLLAGWGVFNVVDGVVSHKLLGIHHIRDDLGGPLAWDLGFLALGVAQVVLGLALARGVSPAAAARSAPSPR